MTTMEAGVPRSAMAPPENVRSVHAAGAMPEPRQYEYLADREPPEPEVAPDPEVPVEGQEGVDPVAENVVEEKAADQEAEQQVARHQVQGDIGTEERATLKAKIEEIETGRTARIAELEGMVSGIEGQISDGSIASHEGDAQVRQIYRQIAQAEAEATRALLPVEARLAAADLTADSRMKADRSRVMADPIFQSLQESGKMEASLNDPNADSPFFPGVSNASLGLQNPAFIAAAEKYGVMKAERDAAMQKIQELEEKDNQRLSNQNPALNRVATGGAPPSGRDSIQQTAKFNPKTDNLVDRLSRHFSA